MKKQILQGRRICFFFFLISILSTNFYILNTQDTYLDCATEENTTADPPGIYSRPIDPNYLDTLAWFENLDGQGNFNTGTFIDQPTPSARSVHASDVDGDIDVILPILAEDTLGREVMAISNFLSSIDMRSLQKGVYFVSIYYQDKVLTQKIVLN